MRVASSRAIASPRPRARGAPAARAVEALEDVLLILRRDPGALVPHRERRRHRPPGPDGARSASPCGVCRRAFSTRMRPIWTTRSWSPAARTSSGPTTPSGWPLESASARNSSQTVRAATARSTCPCSTASCPASSRERSRRSVARRVSRSTCSRVSCRNSLPGPGVEILVVQELEEAAQAEERGSELVRGVRDELAPHAVEVGEPLAHRVEGARELGDLVARRGSRRRASRSPPPRSGRRPSRAA